MNEGYHYTGPLQIEAFKGYYVEDGVKALRFRIQASLAAAYLQCRKYEDVLRYTHATFSCCGSLRSPLPSVRQPGYIYKENYWPTWDDWPEPTLKYLTSLTLSVPGCKFEFASECRHEYAHDYDGRSFSDDHLLDLARTYYCRAMALKYTVDLPKAIKHMERALCCDPGDGQAFMQLGILRREWDESPARIRRLKKLDAPYIKLKEKQEVRKAKRVT